MLKKVLVLSILIATSSSAKDSKNFYGRFDAGYGLAKKINNSPDFKNKNHQMNFGFALGYFIDDKTAIDISINSLNMGQSNRTLALTNITTKTNLSYRFNLSQNISSKLSGNSVFTNTTYYITNIGSARLFLTAGLGAAFVKEEINYLNNNVLECSHSCTPATQDMLDQLDLAFQSKSKSKTILAYQFGGGISYPIENNINLELRYRYLDGLGKTPISKSDISSHSLITNIRFDL